MWRAILKGSGLFVCGWMPGGHRFYRWVTREWMGTQATHVDKLSRVWPAYVDTWQNRCDVQLEGARVWVHEGGWTPLPFLANYLLTGSGGVVTNAEGRVLDRYLARAVNGVLNTKLPEGLVPLPPSRRKEVEALRWCEDVREAIRMVGGSLFEDVEPHNIPLDSTSIDLCHSGGTLEHYHPRSLACFLDECHRILRPGGVASHVFDHRDHLHHADRWLPFLAHLAVPGPVYTVLCGHPLLYHNRLTPTEVMDLFDKAGLQKIAVRRLVLPDRRYVEGDEALTGRPGISRRWLIGARRGIPEQDIRTAAAHYLYRKPH
jgi:SAM-dependent methyltransferase